MKQAVGPKQLGSFLEYWTKHYLWQTLILDHPRFVDDYENSFQFHKKSCTPNINPILFELNGSNVWNDLFSRVWDDYEPKTIGFRV